MNWTAIILIIAWARVGKCEDEVIHFETCPEHGNETIEVDHEVYIILSGKLQTGCYFVIKRNSTYFVKVEIQDTNATNSQYIRFFNSDTAKSYKYTPKSKEKFIISTMLLVLKADIQAILKITPWLQLKTNERNEYDIPTNLSGKVTFITFGAEKQYKSMLEQMIIQRLNFLATTTTTTTTTTTKPTTIATAAATTKTTTTTTTTAATTKTTTKKTTNWMVLYGKMKIAEDSSISITMILQFLFLTVLVMLVIVLSAALAKLVLKSQNQVVSVVSFSNLQGDITHVQVTTNSEMAQEGSGSNHQQIGNMPIVPNVPSVPNVPIVPNIPRSLPTYSECEFDQHNQSNLTSTNTEPPPYDEALKLNWI